MNACLKYLPQYGFFIKSYQDVWREDLITEMYSNSILQDFLTSRRNYKSLLLLQSFPFKKFPWVLDHRNLVNINWKQLLEKLNDFF